MKSLPGAMRIVGYIFIAILGVGTTAALFLPDDILSTSPNLLRFTDVMAGIIPSIDQLTRHSYFSEVTRLLISLAWALAPVLCLVLIYIIVPSSMDPETLRKYRRLRIINTLTAYLGIPAMLIVGMSLIGSDPIRPSGGTYGDRVARAMSQSRFWFGIVTSTISFGYALAVTLMVYWTKNLPEIFRGKSKQ